MPKKLWEPSKALIKNSNLFKYEKFVSKNYKYKINNPYKLSNIKGFENIK